MELFKIEIQTSGMKNTVKVMTSSSMIANDQNVPADPTSLTTGWKNSVTKNANDQLKAAVK